MEPCHIFTVDNGGVTQTLCVNKRETPHKGDHGNISQFDNGKRGKSILCTGRRKIIPRAQSVREAKETVGERKENRTPNPWIVDPSNSAWREEDERSTMGRVDRKIGQHVVERAQA